MHTRARVTGSEAHKCNMKPSAQRELALWGLEHSGYACARGHCEFNENSRLRPSFYMMICKGHDLINN